MEYTFQTAHCLEVLLPDPEQPLCLQHLTYPGKGEQQHNPKYCRRCSQSIAALSDIEVLRERVMPLRTAVFSFISATSSASADRLW